MHKKVVHRQAKVRQKTSVSVGVEVTAKEFHHHEKNQYWYFGMGLLLAAVAVGLAWSQNYLLALVVIALGLAVFRLANVHPNSKAIRLSDRGLYWGDQFFGFHQFKGFWLAETGSQIAFYLERPNFNPLISFVVPESKALLLADTLAEHLPHHHHKGEPLSDQLGRLAKF